MVDNSGPLPGHHKTLPQGLLERAGGGGADDVMAWPSAASGGEGDLGLRAEGAEPEFGLGDVARGRSGRGGWIALGDGGEDRAVAAVAGLLDHLELSARLEDPVVPAAAADHAGQRR